jgi:8-oxo-dGTP pyrophosphatase MutT (NUDIX family)
VSTRTLVYAAGGVLVRDGLVLVVHRPYLDDWTFPKGHLDATDVDLAACAIREVWEETGFQGVLGTTSVVVEYDIGATKRKHVTFWLMSVAAGEFTVNNEVDEARWLTPAEASALLTHDSDRAVLAQLLR